MWLSMPDDTDNKLQKPETRRTKERRVSSFVGNIRHPIMVRFGAAVRERRHILRLTQAEVAIRSGLSRSYLSEVETGRVSLSLERAAELAEALECPLADLLPED